MPVTLSAEKMAAARALAELLVPGRRVCLTTHVNPDGDGLGSEVGLVHLLRGQGVDAVVANPTPTPARFDFLFRDLPKVDRSAEAVKALRGADVIVVLDISDLGRLGMLSETVRDRGVPVACIDHHVSPGTLPAGPRYVDTDVAATGELIAEIALANGWRPRVDLPRYLRQRPGGPAPAAGRDPADAGGGGGRRARLGDGSGGGGRTA
jgi:phosphoesterase RecJ-like protein